MLGWKGSYAQRGRMIGEGACATRLPFSRSRYPVDLPLSTLSTTTVLFLRYPKTATQRPFNRQESDWVISSYQSTMSSLLDAVLHSDAAATPASTAGGPTPRSSGIRSSSARPRGPPSESNAAHSDIEAFPDDEVVGARGGARRPNAPRTDIPKVADVLGETLSFRFQEFLEK